MEEYTFAMIGEMSEMFSKMIGTLAVILVISVFIGISDILSKVVKNHRGKYSMIAGLIGGFFGIYGNISGYDLNGAVISVRDIGPMLSGFIAGPLGGFIGGLIAGVHRLTMGGITAQACVVATCSIGIMCGYISHRWHEKIERPLYALTLSAVMEIFHLCMVLIMVRPIETALDIVRQIAIPFVVVNALGFMLMIIIITYTEKQRALALERNRMQSELEVANVIQHSLLPLLDDEYPGIPELDIAASMEAAKEVGGDFYDVFYVDPSHLAFVIGDVSGKGVPAALFMASSKIALQNCIRDIPQLSKAIESANKTLCDRNEAEMFVTVWAGIFDLTTGVLNYVSAGHNPPVLLRENTAELIKVKSGFVLGGMKEITYKEHSMQLEKGDVIFMYTDGVTEAEDVKHNLFGEERLLKCLSGKNDSSAVSIIRNVEGEIADFIDGNSQFDDITMLCFKWKKDGQ